MFSSSPSRRGNESLGSHSKLKRKSRVSQVFMKSLRRFIAFVVRDTSLLLLLFSLTLFLHFRQDLYGLLENEFSLSAPPISFARDQDDAPDKAHEMGPPSYLPLAQHLKNINVTENKPSLQDMVYGIQRRTHPDLKSTNNKDLDQCAKCRGTVEQVLQSTFLSKKHLKLARAVLKLIAFYDITSMVTIPCSEEAHWVLPLVKAMRVSDFSNAISISFQLGVSPNLTASTNLGTCGMDWSDVGCVSGFRTPLRDFRRFFGSGYDQDIRT